MMASASARLAAPTLVGAYRPVVGQASDRRARHIAAADECQSTYIVHASLVCRYVYSVTGCRKEPFRSARELRLRRLPTRNRRSSPWTARREHGPRHSALRE